MSPLIQNNKMNKKIVWYNIIEVAWRIQIFFSFAMAQTGLLVFFELLLLPVIKEFILFS